MFGRCYRDFIAATAMAANWQMWCGWHGSHFTLWP